MEEALTALNRMKAVGAPLEDREAKLISTEAELQGILHRRPVRQTSAQRQVCSVHEFKVLHYMIGQRLVHGGPILPYTEKSTLLLRDMCT